MNQEPLSPITDELATKNQANDDANKTSSTTNIKEETQLEPKKESTSEKNNEKSGKKGISKNGFGAPNLPLGIRYREIIIFTCWMAAIAFTIWFIYDVVNHYIHSLHNPITSLSLVEHVPLAFPAITICNYNSLHHCDHCSLELEHVTRVLENGSIIDYDLHHEFKTIGDFNCFVLNNDTHHPLPEATLTGYGASYSLFFKVPQMPKKIYNRYGLQVSFHKQGSVPDVLSETNFAMSGVDNFFILTKYHTKYLDKHTTSSNTNPSTGTTTHGLQSSGTEGTTSANEESSSNEEERWKASLAAIGLADPVEDIIVVSFAYATLNQYEIEEMYSMTIETVLGEIGAIIGVLAGLDVMKIVRGFIEIPFAVPYKSLRPIWEVFN